HHHKKLGDHWTVQPTPCRYAWFADAPQDHSSIALYQSATHLTCTLSFCLFGLDFTDPDVATGNGCPGRKCKDHPAVPIPMDALEQSYCSIWHVSHLQLAGLRSIFHRILYLQCVDFI